MQMKYIMADITSVVSKVLHSHLFDKLKYNVSDMHSTDMVLTFNVSHRIISTLHSSS